MHLFPILLGWALLFILGGQVNEHNCFYLLGAWLALNLLGIGWGIVRISARNQDERARREQPPEYDLSIRDQHGERECRVIVSLRKRP